MKIVLFILDYNVCVFFSKIFRHYVVLGDRAAFVLLQGHSAVTLSVES